MSLWTLVVGYFIWQLAGLGTQRTGESDQWDPHVFPSSFRFNSNYVQIQVDQRFSHEEEINCEILGTKIIGVSQSKGRLIAKIEQVESNAHIHCTLIGLIECENKGKNGPAQIDSRTSSSFTAVKIVSFDGKRLTSRPTELDLETVVVITKVDTHLVGLKGVLVKRLASAQAEATKEEVQGIARAMTKKRLAGRIDSEFESQLAAINSALQFCRTCSLSFGNRDVQISTRCIDKDIEVAIVLSPNPR